MMVDMLLPAMATNTSLMPDPLMVDMLLLAMDMKIRFFYEY